VKFLSRLFARRTPSSSPLEEVRTLIERFTTATIVGVDTEDIGRYPPKQRKVMAFHFGAIEYLAQHYGLSETESLAVRSSTGISTFRSPRPAASVNACRAFAITPMNAATWRPAPGPFGAGMKTANAARRWSLVKC
jgi:hypothetical protein